MVLGHACPVTGLAAPLHQSFFRSMGAPTKPFGKGDRWVAQHLDMPRAVIVGLSMGGRSMPALGCVPQVDVLRGEARCLTFDNRGLGRSQPVGAGVTVRRMADDALALMRAVGLPVKA